MTTIRPEMPSEADETERDRLLACDPDSRREQVLAYVRRLCAQVDPEWSDETRDDDVLFLESIAAAEITAIVEADLGVRVPMLELTGGPTLARIADAITAAFDGAPVEHALRQIEPDPTERFEPFGLTDVQHAYWLGRSGLFTLGQVSTHLYLQFESRDFDPERASAALRVLIERHDMLRAVVRPDGRQQVLASVPAYEIAVEDLTGLGEQAAAQRVAALRDRLSHEVRPADRWPLFEVVAQRLPGGVTRVHLSLDLLIADAGSIQILLSEWARLYADPDADLPPLGCTFRDYVTALATWEGSPAYERARAYWMERIHSLPPAPELPLAGAPGTVQPRFTRRQFILDRPRWERLQSHAKTLGVTPSVVLATAYAQVLATWSKTPHFTLNLTVADRLPLHPDVNRVVGDFTSLVLVEVDVAGAKSFTERARQLQQQLWRDLEHRAFSGVRVLRELARAHGPARSQMPVVFTSVLGGGIPADVPGLGRQVDGVSQTPQVHLDHQVYERDGELVACWDAVESLFPAAMLDDMFASYQRLIERLADDPHTWELSPPTIPEAHLALQAEANATSAPLPEGLLHEGVFRVAGERPEAVAVVASGRRVSYGELASTAWRLGRLLRDAGVRPGELVAVSMEKGWEQVAAVLGVLASGGAYVPIDPALPEERRFHLLRRTHARYVVTQDRLLNRLAWPDDVASLTLDALPADDTPLSSASHPDDLAYVIFTSGSTGEPKGVMIDHRGAVNTVIDVNRRFGVGPGDRVLAVSSLSFDLSVWDIFGVLAAGGTVVMPDPGTERDPGHWAELVSREGVTVWNSVPALFELLVEHAAGHGREGRDQLQSLRLAMLSGDWIPVSLPDRARALVRDLRLISLGGATEASIWSIFYPIDAVDPSWTSIPYGWPLTNQTFHVLDEQLNPRPVWVPGELYIGGVGVARGYWEDPERTAASFITHPETGERLYRTGDLGRYLPDGSIEFLGREDFQVKIGGFRIELGEIEAALAQHPDVETAVVAALGDPRGSRRLVAYVVPADRQLQPDPDRIREYLRAKLPAYMVPSAVVTLDALPLTPNGKIDRKALPDPADTTSDRMKFVPASTAEERILVEIWTELLGLEHVSVRDNLFELGADSLLALRAVTLAQERGLTIELRDVFEHPTVAELATRVTSGAIDAEQGPVTGPTGLTPSQVWFLEQDLPERHHWNDASFLLSLQRPLNVDALQRALAQVMAQHDALRMRFRQDVSGWSATIAGLESIHPLPFSVHDFSALDGAAQKRAVTEVSNRLQRSLDLADGPLLRVAYFDLGERPHCLLFLAHWLVVDHYSARTLLEDLLSSYEQYEAGAETATLLPKTTSVVRWTAALYEYARSPEVTKELAYWTDPAREKAVPLRLDRVDGENSLESLGTLTLRLDHDLTEALLREVPRAGINIVDVLCTALVRALPLDATDHGPRHVLVDLERHGRDLALPGLSVARTVGRFSTIAPVLLRVDPTQPPDAAVRDVHDQLADVPNQGAGYGLLRYLGNPEHARMLAELPPAQVGLNYVGQVDEIFLRSDLLSVPRMSYGEQRSRTGRRFRVLDVLGYVVARRLTFTIGYSRNLHEASTIEVFARDFEAELRSIARSAYSG